jgi:HAD superfamily hydrolase (TIGR01549 family)
MWSGAAGAKRCLYGGLMSITPVTTVLFDFAWTLFATHPEMWVGKAAALIGRQVPPGEPQRLTAEFAELLRTTAADPEHIVRDLDPAVWDQAILAVLQQTRGVDLEFAKALHETRASGIQPYADTAATLALLKASNIRVGVVSNTGWDIRKCFAHHGLDRYVDEFVLSYEVGCVKPDERIWRIALDSLGADPRQTIMVGDHPGVDGGSVVAGIAAVVLPMVSSSNERRGFDHVVTLACGRG